MSKLSEKQIKEIKTLRKRGLSYREISEQLKIALTTAFYYGRDVEQHNNHNEAGERLEEEKSKILGEEATQKLGTKVAKTLKAQVGVDVDTPGWRKQFWGFEFKEMWYSLTILPYTIICPRCEREVKEVGFCYECGSFFCDCGQNLDLRKAQRKEEVSLK